MDELVARLVAKDSTPALTLVEIERSPDYMAIIASDEGQALLEWLARDAIVRRGGRVDEEAETP